MLTIDKHDSFILNNQVEIYSTNNAIKEIRIHFMFSILIKKKI